MLPARPARAALVALSVGLLLTIVAAVAPFVERSRLAAHISAGYPEYTAGEVTAAVDAWLIVLATVGVLGLAGWLLTSWAVATGKRWAALVTAALFVLGLATAVAGLTFTETPGDVGLAPVFGWLLLLPCLPGLLAVVLTMRRRHDPPSSRPVAGAESGARSGPVGDA